MGLVHQSTLQLKFFIQPETFHISKLKELKLLARIMHYNDEHRHALAPVLEDHYESFDIADRLTNRYRLLVLSAI